MADNETIADIVAGKRALADRMEHEMAVAKECKEPFAHRTAQAIIDETRREADRIWAAHDHDIATATEASARAVVGACVKRQEAERDAAKLREALAPFPSLCNWLVINAARLGILDMVEKLRERGDKARAALGEPVRQCDVGTAKEQVKRWRRFCNSMTTCGECPCHKSYSEVVTDCFSRWAQMPCEEGGDDGQ